MKCILSLVGSFGGSLGRVSVLKLGDVLLAWVQYLGSLGFYFSGSHIDRVEIKMVWAMYQVSMSFNMLVAVDT